MLVINCIDKNYSSRKNQEIKYIVIHDTANKRKGANAYNHYLYFGSAHRNSSAHFFVDDCNILQILPIGYAAWHVGDGKRGIITNENSIGVEMCINEDSDRNMTKNNMIRLIHYLLLMCKLPATSVVRHFDASDKICPGSMSQNNWQEWKEFIKSI